MSAVIFTRIDQAPVKIRTGAKRPISTQKISTLLEIGRFAPVLIFTGACVVSEQLER
jgi:hypothetical protein